LINRDGERFMTRYAPVSLDLAPRDVVARAIEREIAAGRGFDGACVHLDLRQLGEELINDRLPGIRQLAMDFAGVDPVKQPIPIQPGQHYSMGGIDVGIDGRSGLPGLYAAGECACISVHGANRLGGNSLLETVVFGRLVADAIISEVASGTVPQQEPAVAAVEETTERIRSVFSQTGGGSPFLLIDSLKETMYKHFGIFREKKVMEEGLTRIMELKSRMGNVSFSDKDRAANQVLIRYLELENMLLLAETVAIGAIRREESRGSHTRLDYPDRDDTRFLRHTLIHLEDGSPVLSYGPVTTGMFEPEERVY